VPIFRDNENTGAQVENIYRGTYSSTILLDATERIPEANPYNVRPINRAGNVSMHWTPQPIVPIAQAIKCALLLPY
jgi:hypothetical protein